MKQETNNEMDLLLRRLGRRPDEPASNGDGRVEHLDADELSAYAENALPIAARARYTEHLAECSRCRAIVTSLSASAGVVVAQETTTAVEPSGFKKFLASLISPMVLRYAVPALGLVLIAVIGLIALRRPEDSNTDFVVQVPREEPAQAPATQSPPTGTYGYDNANAAGRVDALKKEAQPKSDEQPAPVPNAPPTVSSINAQTRPQDSAAGAGAAQPAPQESPAAAPKAADTAEAKTRNEAEARKETKQEAVAVANEPPKVETTSAETGAIAERKVADLPARSDRRGLTALSPASAARAKVQKDGEDDNDKNFVETRSVAGRRFRKENGVWTDTAYNSSRSTMVIARGSEQFRALVADEPVIKTIADELDGEILVVWKGRSYRIR